MQVQEALYSLTQRYWAARWALFYFVLWFYFVGKYRQYRRLRQFSGPSIAGWSELWHSRAVASRECHLRYNRITERYGPIARIGPNELLTSSTELLCHMSSVRSPYTRSHWYNIGTRVRPGVDHVFSELDEEKHTKRRQQMASGYSGKENLNLESDIDAQVYNLISLLRKRYLSTESEAKSFDFAQKIQYFTLDVISTVGFGEPFGLLKKDGDVNDYVASAEEGLSIMVFMSAWGLNRYLQWPPIARLLGPKETDKGGLGRMIYAGRQIIDARLAKTTQGRSDMLASFMRHGLEKDDLLTEALLQIVAGSDTTASALRALMLYVVSNPRVYKKLQKEVDSACEGRKLKSAGNVASDKMTRNLPYLQAVIREGLRMHPPITDPVPKKVPAGGDTVEINGERVFLPGGTDITYSVWSVHHDKATFGEDADCFRPERWLLDDEGDQERLNFMKRTTELIFGYGKYQCLGKPIAWMEINKALFEFMRNFEWALATPEKPWESLNYYGLFVQKNMRMYITERKPSV